MKKLVKNKIFLITAGILILVLVVGGGLFLFLPKSSQNQTGQETAAMPTQIPIPTITADSIGLTLKVGIPGQTVIAAVANTQGIEAIDYEFSYIAKGNITRGTFGKIDVNKKPSQSTIVLGTCSDVCHYDQDVSDIKIVLKITKSDGNVYQSQASLSSAE